MVNEKLSELAKKKLIFEFTRKINIENFLYKNKNYEEIWFSNI